jgi:hypothetical protein
VAWLFPPLSLLILVEGIKGYEWKIVSEISHSPLWGYMPSVDMFDKTKIRRQTIPFLNSASSWEEWRGE